jgi:hypothetical protein
LGEIELSNWVGAGGVNATTKSAAFSQSVTATSKLANQFGFGPSLLSLMLILALRGLSDAPTLDSTRYIAISIVISTFTSKLLFVIRHHRKQCLY